MWRWFQFWQTKLDQPSYVYMDTNVWNKGLIRIKMIHVNMSIGKFWSDLAHSKRNDISIKRADMYWSLLRILHVNTYSNQDFLFGVESPSLRMCTSQLDPREQQKLNQGSQNLAQVHSVRVKSLNCREMCKSTKCGHIVVYLQPRWK